VRLVAGRPGEQLGERRGRRRAHGLLVLGPGERVEAHGHRRGRGLGRERRRLGAVLVLDALVGRPGVDLDHRPREEPADPADPPVAVRLDDRVVAELLADPRQDLLERAPAVRRRVAHATSSWVAAPTTPRVSTRRPGGTSW
jgi:hypothetical protein